MRVRNIVNDDLSNTSWLGEVVDIEDPQKIGRIKVKVFGKFDLISTENIPWAYPANNITSGSSSGGSFFSVPKLGSIVSIKFESGNLYHPEYYYIQKISDEVKEEIENSYENSHIIIYDTETDGSLKVFFTEEKGLMLDYQETKINIKPDKSIQLISASGDSNVEITDDGNINITLATDVNIDCQNANITLATDVNIDCQNANIISSVETHIDSPKIKLGVDAAEAIIKGDTFKQIFDSHVHPTGVGPSGPPTVSMESSLSNKNSTD